MDLTLFLLAGHMVGDFLVQTDHQATYKARPDCWPGVHAMETKEGIRARSPGGRDRRLNRGLSWRANQAHVFTYHWTLSVALIYPLWGHPILARLLVAFALSWALHSLIDRRWPVRWLVRVTGSPEFAKTTLGILAADQALHVATLAVMAAVLG
jgi:hypothetical protein